MTCPTPEKVTHPSEAAAWAHARALRRAKDASVDLKPYECRCGAWHVGHSQQALRNRIRRAHTDSAAVGTRRKRHKR